MLAKIKLNSIERLISQALIDIEISHEEFVTIFNEKDIYEKIKENFRRENEKQEIMRLSSIKFKWKTVKNYRTFYVIKKNIFFLVKITKETCGKCGIKTVKHYNEKRI